jgi:hypothetical protein
MKTQTIIWTALPNGVAGVAAKAAGGVARVAGGAARVAPAPARGDLRLKLSVFVSPRLWVDGAETTLGQFPDFLDWPAAVKSMQFKVQFNGGPAIAAEQSNAAPDSLDSTLWTAIFTADTYLEPHKFTDYSKARIISYPASNVDAHIRELYQAAFAEAPDKRPVITANGQKYPAMRQLLGNMAVSSQTRADLKQQRSAHLQTTGAQAVVNAPKTGDNTRVKAARSGVSKARPEATTFRPTLPQAGSDLAQVAAFHGMDTKAIRARMPTVADLVHSIDFHQIVASLGQFPSLMRRLGLIVDLEVPVSAMPASPGSVQVTVAWTPKTQTTNSRPKTHYVSGNGKFAAQPQPSGSHIKDGMLALGDSEEYDVIQVDVDGAGIKTLQLAEKVSIHSAVSAIQAKTAARLATGAAAAVASAPAPTVSSASTTDDTALPALRSAGLAVTKLNYAADIADSLKKSATNNAATEADLYAEDVTRGYRVDVWDAKANKWCSLCQREGAYTFAKTGQTVNIEDEGWVSTAATQPPDGTGAELYVHEALFRWEGWSLCAPRPGQPIKVDGNVSQDDTQFGLTTKFTPKAQSLPKLRFGNEYRLRARIVDLAGNSVPPDSTDAANATETIEYDRHEPIVAPTVVPRVDLSQSPGESVDRPVIRSFNSDPTKDTQTTNQVSQRHIAPPKTSEQMAETHGMFDAASGMKSDAATFNLISTRDGKLDSAHDVDQLTLPYLPDPLAYAAVIQYQLLTSPPGATAPVQTALTIPFDGTWPDGKPFRIVLVEPTDDSRLPTFDTTQRVLNVPLHKAEVAQIQLSCCMKPDDLPRMALWHWTVEGIAAPSVQAAKLPAADAHLVRRSLARVEELPKVTAKANLSALQTQQIQKLHTTIVAGRSWLLTPDRTVTLVHAVQQPLIIPKFQNLQSSRQFGWTYAVLHDDAPMPLDGKSTAKLDVLATWEEPLDTGTDSQPPTRVKGNAHVFEALVERDDSVFYLGIESVSSPPQLPKAINRGPARARLGDIVTETAVPAVAPRAGAGAARRPAARVVPTESKAETPTVAAVPAKTEASAKAAPVKLAGLATALLEFPEYRHEFGDTKYRQVQYTAVATTRFREYFDPGQVSSGALTLTRQSPVATVDVLSSARPAAPKVLYVIPTFGWQKQTTNAGIVSKRIGGGLRVYLERPWFSSGDGELLGIVLYQPAGGTTFTAMAAASPDMDALKPYITQWGADPIWNSGGMASTPTPNDFKGAVTESGLTLDELKGARVSVAGFPVTYDATRQLWFCDIEMDAGNSYYPFVRLALTRYQPMSVKTAEADVKLSRVILADFAQLAPDRTASVAFAGREKRQVQVTVTGPAGNAQRLGPQEAQMKAVLEARTPQGGDLGWAPVENGVVPMAPQRVNDRVSAWRATVNLPGPYQAQTYRVVVQEYEWFAADEAEETVERSAPPVAKGPAAGMKPMMAAEQPPAARVVYADVLEI